MKAQNWSKLKTRHEKILIIKFGAKRNFRPHFMPPSPHSKKIFFDVIFDISTYVLGKHNVSTLCVE
jgi:hypothetical protein